MRSAIAAIVALTVLAAPAGAQDTPRPRTQEPGQITVVGFGEVTASPDMATITVGIVAQSRTTGEALAQVRQTMTQATGVLRQAGIEQRDLQTTTFQVRPQYQTVPNRPARITGVEVAAELIVRVRDLTKLGEILDRVVALGANSVTGPEFGLANPQAARDAARRAAVEDALRRARIMTEPLGVRLGRILQIDEGGGPAPLRRGGRGRAMMAAPSAAQSVPIEAGEETIRAEVTVIWELSQ
jgi:uncharacterized protein YggE